MIKILDRWGKELLVLEVDSLSGANLSGANLSYANLSGVDLRGVDLSGVDLSYANLSGANLSGVDLSGVDLRGADLRGADLRGADLRGADLSGVDLRGVDLSGVDLSGADLRGADLSGADLIIITWSHWTTYITPGHIRIGCQAHSLDEWRNFNDLQIADMSLKALDFWKQNKELIIGLCERFSVKQGQVIRYRRYLDKYGQIITVGIDASFRDDFVKWLDDDWQEMKVDGE